MTREAGPRRRRAAWGSTLAMTALGLVAAGCDAPCPYRLVTRLDSGERSVPCCGRATSLDVVVPDVRDLAVDVSQAAVSGRLGGQDVWLAPADCAQLFDQPYPEPGTAPLPAPRCRVLAGPVAPGRVSPRVEVTPGTYRLFIQPYAANPAENAYRVVVGVWGTSCGVSPVAP